MYGYISQIILFTRIIKFKLNKKSILDKNHLENDNIKTSIYIKYSLNIHNLKQMGYLMHFYIALLSCSI